MDSHKGFTLVELLIVVAIIALLVVIAMPSASRARAAVDRARCATNLRCIGAAVLNYITANNENLPTHYADPATSFDTFLMRRVDGVSVNLGLLDELPGREVLYCPAQPAKRSPALASNSAANPWTGSPLRSSYAARGLPPPEPGVEPEPWSMLRYCDRVVYSGFTSVDGWPGSVDLPGPIRAPHDGEGCNRLLGNGSVRWTAASVVEQVRPVGPAAPTPTEIVAYWESLDNLLVFSE